MSCTSSAKRGGDHLGDASSAATPLTSSSTAPNTKKLDSSDKYDYTNWNNYSKGDNKKKNHFGDKKKKFQKIMF
jgi:hypothetical protein